MKNSPSFLILRKIRAISDYQFGPAITDVLFDNNTESIHIIFSKNTGKMKHIYEKDKILLNFRPKIGLFTLTFHSASKIISELPIPKVRAVVLNEISEFIRKGRNVFCKHILEIDINLRPLDEVIVVNQEDEILAIGRLSMPIPYIKTFSTGIAINVRKGNKSKL
jgi:archaeosine-15-forming tRNA-guanine transglycosylase